MNVTEPLMSAVGSSSGLERNFSSLGLLYGKLRAQLEPEKAGQLTFLYRQYNKHKPGPAQVGAISKAQK